MGETQITTVQSVIGVNLCIVYALVAFFLIKNRKGNKYPVGIASTLLLSASLWLVNNLIVDITESDWTRLIFGRFSFVTAYLVTLCFVLFSLLFPPAHKKITQRIVLVISLTIALFGSIFALHPAGVFSGIDQSVDHYASPSPLWGNILLHFSYVLLASIGCFTLITKIKKMTTADQKAVVLIGLGLLINITFIVIISIFSVANIGNLYYQPLTYLSSFFFLLFFVAAILRFGALSRNITFSLRILLGTSIAVALIIIWLLFDNA